MIETVGNLIKSLHSFGSAKEIWILHEGELIRVQSISGASDGSVILMTERATSPVPAKLKSQTASSDSGVADALDHCDHILSLCDDVEGKGEDFAADIAEKVQSVRDWIEENDHVTEKQLSALEGWERGVSRWLKD